MDAMEDMDLLSGSNTHLSKLSSDGNMAANTGATSATISVPSGSGQTLPVKSPVVIKNTGPTPYPGIKYRNIGKSGLKCPNVGLGSIKVFNNDPDKSEEIITLAYESGINYFDISDPYLADSTEVQLGRILKKKGWPRRNYVVSTKIYWHKKDMACLSRKEIIESVKQSLINLGMDYIDLIIIHKSDTSCPMEEVVRAMTYLVDNGMIMYWGTARWSPFEIFEAFSAAKEFHHVPPIVELSEYHWFHREKVELFMAELYNKIGVGCMTWSPISFGLSLNGKSEDNTSLFTKLSIKNYKAPKVEATTVMMPQTTITNQPSPVVSIGHPKMNMAMGVSSTRINDGAEGPVGVTSMVTAPVMDEVDVAHARIKALTGMAEKMGATLSQLAIAWTMRNSTSQCVILSASTPDHLLEILNSLPFIAKITHPVNEDIDKILSNKPSRPPMISTLQTRWAATGGVPPC
jgi:potassium voltage-gated channel Shaker-related subfamily A beta protein 2